MTAPPSRARVRGIPMAAAEQRAHARFPARLRAVFEVEGARVAALTKDISLGGMFVETAASPAFGATLTVTVDLPLLAEIAPLRCVVRWVTPAGFGVSFVSLRAAETWAINRLAVHAR